MNTIARHPPTYEEATVPYSLRLPAYRSTYIRRYHPYARYALPAREEFLDEEDPDAEFLLDISALIIRVQPGHRDAIATGDEGHVHDGEQGCPVKVLSPTVVDTLLALEGPRLD